ncbi:MAG: acetylglutamate kinase [Candidatus Deianiraeaceae bacterium]|jgi:acetylglutamate kinase
MKNIEAVKKAEILMEALPYIKKFSGETFVVKFGGSAMGNKDSVKDFAQNIVLLKSCGINVIVVHGGGPQISAMLERMNIKSQFIDGVRVTTKDMIDIVEMVLCGSINKEIVSIINQNGGTALGLSGKDANLIKAKKIRKTSKETDSNIERILDLGYVGVPTQINVDFFDALESTPVVPVIAPVGFDNEGNTYNINADIVAGMIASELEASKLILITDVDGVQNNQEELISSLTTYNAEEMIRDKQIHGGMIPKVETCIKAIRGGVETVHIINGNKQHALLLEILTDSGIGTMIFE